MRDGPWASTGRQAANRGACGGVGVLQRPPSSAPRSAAALPFLLTPGASSAGPQLPTVTGTRLPNDGSVREHPQHTLSGFRPIRRACWWCALWHLVSALTVWAWALVQHSSFITNKPQPPLLLRKAERPQCPPGWAGPGAFSVFGPTPPPVASCRSAASNAR